MPLDPQVRQVLDLVAKADKPPYWSLSAPQARVQHEANAPVLDVRPIPVHAVRDEILGAGGRDVPVRIYVPFESGEPLPVLVWLHGGGHVVGSVQCYDALCRTLAHEAGCVVVSVEYALAPEHPFPAAVEDSFAALAWVAANASSFGADPACLAIGGDSAGGNLAAVCALMARDAGGPRLVHQLLVYPVTAARPDSPSHHAYGQGYLLDRPTIEWFRAQYLPDEAACDDWRLAPLLAPDHAGLAPAHVIVAEYDPLHDEGVAYAERLRAAGTAVELERYPGMVHAFMSMPAAIDDGAKAIGSAARHLRDAFAAAGRAPRPRG